MTNNKYQVIITLAGNGKRFSDAGYTLPKYLLPVSENKCVLDLVADMYDGLDILFICNCHHVEKYNLINRFEKKNRRVIGVLPGQGPGYSMWQAKDYIDKKKKTIVQYCDTFQIMDLKAVLKEIDSSKADAGIFVTSEKCPSVYDGTKYGRVKIDKSGNVVGIKEKAEESYSPYLGCGTFYFKSGEYLISLLKTQIENKDKYFLNGEAYVNCTFNVIEDQKDKIKAIDINGYINLGVPTDYEEFMSRKKRFDKLNRFKEPVKLRNSTLMMPAVGLGSRFKSYGIPKPFIKISDKYMCEMAKKFSFPTENQILAIRKDLPGYKKFVDYSKKNGINLHVFEHITEGQAITVTESLKDVANGQMVVVNSCDQGILYDENKFYEIYPDADVIICGIKNYQKGIQNPNAYSWIRNDGTDVLEITSKRCVGNPRDSYLFVSCVLYKNKSIIEKSVERMIRRQARINGEYYIDESLNDSISLGYRVKMLEIDSYLNWGTPEELELSLWWNNFFKEIEL